MASMGALEDVVVVFLKVWSLLGGFSLMSVVVTSDKQSSRDIIFWD